MLKFLSRRPLVAWSLLVYVAFIGMAMSVLEVALFLWPYIFLLSLQQLLGPPDSWPFLVSLPFGGVCVGAVAEICQRRLGEGRPEDRFYAFWAGGLITLVTLACITLLSHVAARLLGWPLGV